MKAIIIVDIDPEQLMDAHSGVKQLEDGTFKVTDLEDAISAEMGWVDPSGIFIEGVILEDSIKPNDADLGDQVRKHLID